MTILKAALIVAAVAFFCFSFFKLMQLLLREWAKTRAEEKERRRKSSALVTRRGELNL